MLSEIDASLADPATPTVGVASDESLLGRLMHVSEPAAEQVGAPLRTGFLLLALFEVVYLLEVWLFERKYAAIATYFCVFDLALATTAFGATYFQWFKQHWRELTMALCLAVIVSR